MNYSPYRNYSDTKEYEPRIVIDENTPETLTNPVYTPAFLRENIGKLVRVEFLIGTNTLQDRIGILAEVGASFIVLRSVESNNLVYCDLYSIKFVTISQDPFPIYGPEFLV